MRIVILVLPGGVASTARVLVRRRRACQRTGQGRSAAFGPPLAILGARLAADMKVRAVIRLIGNDGWRLVGTRESHRQFSHPFKPGRVTIAGHPADDLAPGTLGSILKQAGLRK
jgi:predicted RNA binding protein YcfA (HicA-like mRNA interferase family)